MNGMPTLYIVDDDAAVRDALAMLLDVAGYHVAAFPDANSFLAACTPDTSGCLILDVKMPGMDGPALQEELAHRGMTLPVIFLSGQGTIAMTVRTIKAGAVDFLTKPVDGLVLLACVQKALAQHVQLREQALSSREVSRKLALLTDREREIMMLAVAGKTSKEIAASLCISYRTVEAHRARVMHKTGTSNTLELALLASQDTAPVGK